jgi:predicted subunit of tRNA(5-methylaminomethyl-2-thiouridylate) methyltransferase
VIQGIEARRRKDSAQWELGDLSLKVASNYGEHTLEDYAAGIGVEYNSLRQYRTVAAAYRNDERSSFLSWSHHLKIADRDDRLEWLKWAAEGKWSVRRMVSEILQIGEILNQST